MIHIRFDTGMGGFATLIAIVPWQVLQALGWSEAQAAYVACVFLFALACAALVMSRSTAAQRDFAVPGLRERFHVDNFLRGFASYGLALLAIYGGLWLFFHFTDR